MSKRIYKEIPNILLIIAMLVAGTLAYPYLPDRIPSHWNLGGEINGYSDKLYGIYTMPLITLGIYIMFNLLPIIDPRRENYVKFFDVYNKLKFTLVLFFSLMYAAILLFSLGYLTDMNKIIIFMLGALFILLGNYFGKIRQNYFVGIKLPWTLADEEVWNKTHRLGGKLWVISGILGLISAFIGAPYSRIIFFAVLLSSTLATVVYSYIIYNRKK